jgi:hypothetical protein
MQSPGTLPCRPPAGAVHDREIGRRRQALGVLLSLGLLACGGGGGTPGDTASQEIKRSSGRLEGEWVLVEFRPRDQLEPMFAALLAAQMGQLRVSFREGQMSITGVGVQAERTYKVTQAAADGFNAVMIDPNGVSYQVTGAFQGVDLAFVSHSDPWQGNGRLRRLR